MAHAPKAAAGFARPLGLLFAAALGLAALFFPITAGAEEVPKAPEQPLLIIFHTGEVGGQAREARDSGGRLTSFGYARMKSFINRQAAGGTLLLDGGNALHGRALAAAGRGEFIAHLLEAVNYDALALGGHDFDHGLARLMELRERHSLNFIAANIVSKEDGAALLPPYLVKEYNGLKVGIVGLASPFAPRLTSPEHLRSVVFGNPEDAAAIARLMVDKLRREAGAELVIALGHLGSDPRVGFSAQDLAREVPGLDLIIDGRNAGQGFALTVGETLVVGAASGLRNLGQVIVSRDLGKLRLTPRLIPAHEFNSLAPEPILDALANEMEKEAERERSQTAGRLPFPLDGDSARLRSGSSNFGRLVCAALQRATQADAALLSGGDFHGSLPAGNFSRKDLDAALAERHAVTVRLTGSELLSALNHGLGQVGTSTFPQFYGLRVTALETGGSAARRYRAESVEVGDRPLDPEASYTLAISDHLYRGGEGYRLFSRYPAQTHRPLGDIVLDYLAQTDPERLAEIDRDEVLTVIAEEP